MLNVLYKTCVCTRCENNPRLTVKSARSVHEFDWLFIHSGGSGRAHFALQIIYTYWKLRIVLWTKVKFTRWRPDSGIEIIHLGRCHYTEHFRNSKNIIVLLRVGCHLQHIMGIKLRTAIDPPGMCGMGTETSRRLYEN